MTDAAPPNPDEPFDRSKPYAIGSDFLPGFSKLMEEIGEVGQVVGKIIGLGHMGAHWDGQYLRDELHKELGDLLGAVDFLVLHNQLDKRAIEHRRDKKRNRFAQWHDNIQAGRLPNEGVMF